MKDFKDIFSVGTRVNVTAAPEDSFFDFTGTVIGYKGKLVQVRDQDDDVFDCDPEQVSFNTDDIMHENA